MTLELPHNRDIEAQLLGRLLMHDDTLEALGFLKPEHFYVPVHQRIFEEICRLHMEAKLVSPLALKAKFDADPDLKELGGSAYLIRCTGISTALNPVKFAQHLVELHQRRILIEKMKEAIEALVKDNGDAADYASRMIAWGEEILEGDTDSQTQTGEEVFQEIVNDLKQKKKSVSTGLLRLDRAMGGGLHQGRSYGFAARRKIGKTILASTLSCNLAQRGVKHLFICAEMSAKEIHIRNVSRMGKIHSDTFLQNPEGITDRLQEKLNIAANWPQKNIIYRNAPGLTFDKLRTIVLREVARKKIKGVILDYWQLVKGEKKGQLVAAHLDDVSQWLADTAKKYGIFVIAMAQINQEGNTRGSEGLGNAFDQVFQIHREDPTMPETWVQCMVSRHTKALDIGTKDEPGWLIDGYGPAFEEI